MEIIEPTPGPGSRESVDEVVIRKGGRRRYLSVLPAGQNLPLRVVPTVFPIGDPPFDGSQLHITVDSVPEYLGREAIVGLPPYYQTPAGLAKKR
jgi:hypothetical protein